MEIVRSLAEVESFRVGDYGGLPTRSHKVDPRLCLRLVDFELAESSAGLLSCLRGFHRFRRLRGLGLG